MKFSKLANLTLVALMSACIVLPSTADATKEDSWNAIGTYDVIKSTVDKAQVYNLDDKDNLTPVPGKKVEKLSAWVTDRQIENNKTNEKYDRISTTEYLLDSNVKFTSFEQNGIAKTNAKNIILYSRDGVVYSNSSKELLADTEYPYVAYAKDAQGTEYYKVAENGWVKKSDVTINPAPEKSVYQNPSDMLQIQTKQIKPNGQIGYWLYNGVEGVKVWQVRRFFGLSNVHTIYDAQVINLVRNWQAQHGLNPTGVVDHETWSAMGFLERDWEGLDSYIAPLRTNAQSTRSDHIEAMIAEAYRYLGKPWISGAASNTWFGVDCSGLVTQAMYASGVDPAPVTSIQHAQPGNEWNSRLMYNDSRIRTVNYNDRQRGDLVFYRSPYDGMIWHVAIYLGNNQVIDSWPPYVAINNLNNPAYSSIARIGRVFW